MRYAIAYIFIIVFLIGVCKPTIYALGGVSDSVVADFSKNKTTAIPESNEKSGNENPKGSSEFADDLDNFFYNQSLLHFSFSKTGFYLSETTLVSGFTDILIPPPKF